MESEGSYLISLLTGISPVRHNYILKITISKD